MSYGLVFWPYESSKFSFHNIGPHQWESEGFHFTFWIRCKCTINDYHFSNTWTKTLLGHGSVTIISYSSLLQTESWHLMSSIFRVRRYSIWSYLICYFSMYLLTSTFSNEEKIACLPFLKLFLFWLWIGSSEVYWAWNMHLLIKFWNIDEFLRLLIHCVSDCLHILICKRTLTRYEKEHWLTGIKSERR